MPERFSTVAIYTSVLFSHGGAHRIITSSSSLAVPSLSVSDVYKRQGLIPLIPVRLLNSLLSVWQSMATELHCSSIVVTQRCFKMCIRDRHRITNVYLYLNWENVSKKMKVRTQQNFNRKTYETVFGLSLIHIW